MLFSLVQLNKIFYSASTQWVMITTVADWTMNAYLTDEAAMSLYHVADVKKKQKNKKTKTKKKKRLQTSDKKKKK